MSTEEKEVFKNIFTSDYDSISQKRKDGINANSKHRRNKAA